MSWCEMNRLSNNGRCPESGGGAVRRWWQEVVGGGGGRRAGERGELTDYVARYETHEELGDPRANQITTICTALPPCRKDSHTETERREIER